MSRAPSNFRQQDVARAIKAAKSAGLNVTGVEVDPKTARIVLKIGLVQDDETEIAKIEVEDVNPFRAAPFPDPARTRKKKHNADREC